MVTVTFTGDSSAEVLKEVHAMAHIGSAEKIDAVGKLAKKEKVAETPAPTNTGKEEAKPATSAAPTLEDLKVAVKDLMAIETIGKAGVIKFLDEQYKVKKASEIPVEKYAEFLAKAKGLMAS